MNKKKNGEKNYLLGLVTVVLSWLILGAFLMGAWRFFGVADVDVPCVALDGVDFVMYGFEGDRETRGDAAALLDALAGLELESVDGVPVDMVRHLDVGLYRGFELIGTVLFWHEAGMGRWWVVLNDAARGYCGTYTVDVAGVMQVFDALRVES